MSKIVAIIAEYNPFHNGHKYQIDRIREEIPNATIIAIMSGNIVQRGELAFLDKYARAEMAIKCGIDAVFELPFPYSCSTAEIFASAGVEIASKLGAEYLYFGIESDNLNELENIADAMESEKFEEYLANLNEEQFTSYPVLREKALKKMGIDVSKSSNDMLAIEYIRAIKNKKLPLEYRAIKRTGAGYNSRAVCEIMSARAIREQFNKNKVVLSVPENIKSIIEREWESGRINDKSATNRFILTSMLFATSNDIDNSFDVPNGMGGLIISTAKKCKNPECYTDELSAKSYTTARLKRAIMYYLFKVNSINKCPEFTVLLGANEKGKNVIKKSRKTANIDIITKHSDAKGLSQGSYDIYEKGLKADEVFASLCQSPYSPDEIYKKTPYIE